jgi:hypothetical protein
MRRVTSGVGGDTTGFALVVRRGGGVLGLSMIQLCVLIEFVCEEVVVEIYYICDEAEVGGE